MSTVANAMSELVSVLFAVDLAGGSASSPVGQTGNLAGPVGQTGGPTPASKLTGRFEAYPVGKAPAPPFYIYTVDDQGEFYTDNRTYARFPRMHVELFEKVSDPALEESVRDALESAFGPVEQVGSWSQSEMCHIEQYDFTYKKEEEQ